MSVGEDIATMEFDEQSDYTELSLTNRPGTPSSVGVTVGTSDGYESMSDDDDKHQNPMAVYLSVISGRLVTDEDGFSLFIPDAGVTPTRFRGGPTPAPWDKVETQE